MPERLHRAFLGIAAGETSLGTGTAVARVDRPRLDEQPDAPPDPAHCASRSWRGTREPALGEHGLTRNRRSQPSWRRVSPSGRLRLPTPSCEKRQSSMIRRCIGLFIQARTITAGSGGPGAQAGPRQQRCGEPHGAGALDGGAGVMFSSPSARRRACFRPSGRAQVQPQPALSRAARHAVDRRLDGSRCPQAVAPTVEAPAERAQDGVRRRRLASYI